MIASCDGERQVAYEQVMQGMPLLCSFVTESLRVHPASMGSVRVAGEDVEIMGHLVRKGSLINLNFCAAHFDENIYPNAHELIPERFMTGNTSPILTFGVRGSTHYWSGAALAKLQSKVLFSVLLRTYTCALDEDQSREFRFAPEIFPKSGVVFSTFDKRNFWNYK